MLAFLAWALFCLFGAFVCWHGIRKSRPWLSGLACVCGAVLVVSGLRALGLLNTSLEAYAVGEPPPATLPGSIWSIASLGVVVKFAPLWLLGR
jgi:hypothetical protein